ncbi:MAG: hypothetical protein A3G93_02545 [Nitrospinae bacterium RIFCSPLOWO2_12_FULL_45_22]|nr:MAG: hypothetical protein A3G93_02545 [Nitrospinae bacterium RIFCSPLOWO2_12_FULL_45_22]
MKILDRKKLEELLAPYPGSTLKERFQHFCQEKTTQSPNQSPAFSSLVDRGGEKVYLYGENPALIEQLRDVIWHAPSGRTG